MYPLSDGGTQSSRGARPAPSSRFRGGASQVSLTNLWTLMDDGLPGAVTRSFEIGFATEPLRVSRSSSLESRCAVRSPRSYCPMWC